MNNIWLAKVDYGLKRLTMLTMVNHIIMDDHYDMFDHCDIDILLPHLTLSIMIVHVWICLTIKNLLDHISTSLIMDDHYEMIILWH